MSLNVITVLRDPVERWFSQFFFNKNTNYSKFDISLELEDFVETDRAASWGRIYVNIMTRDLPKDISLNQRIEVATERLKNFSLVGTLENIKQFKEEFRQIFSSELHIKQLNKTPESKRKQNDDISPEVCDRVNEICKPDMQVYKNIIGKSG